MLNKQQPIGIFDSGVGGLTVVRFVLANLPGERIVYFGDTARLPYGSKTVEEIIAFGDEIVSFLMKFDVKVVVAACNTSSSVSLPHLRKRFQVPILGVVEPGARAALQVTANKRVGVIATAATASSGAYERAFRQQDPEVRVFVKACPRFVPLVESGLADTPEARAAAREYLEPLKEAGIDTLVYGCTHYPFLAGVIREVLGDGVRLVDPAEETVRELASLAGIGGGEPVSFREHRFFTSGSPASFYNSGRRFLGDFPLVVEQVGPGQEAEGNGGRD